MGAGTPGKGASITPGGDGPGVRPPKEGDKGPGVRPPKKPEVKNPTITPAPLPPVADKPAGPGLFGQLLEGIKKTDKFRNKIKEGGKGIGGFPGDLPSEILNPPSPKMPKFVDPAFDRDRFEKAIRGEVTLTRNERGDMEAAPGTSLKDAAKDEMEGMLSQVKGVRSKDLVNRLAEMEDRLEQKRRESEMRSPSRFPMGGNEGDDSPFSQERFDRYQAGFRPREKEAVFFGEREPSTGSRPRTKESPKRGMRKTGRPVDAEAKNKFEEMLAYMKSFQR